MAEIVSIQELDNKIVCLTQNPCLCIELYCIHANDYDTYTYSYYGDVSKQVWLGKWLTIFYPADEDQKEWPYDKANLARFIGCKLDTIKEHKTVVHGLLDASEKIGHRVDLGTFALHCNRPDIAIRVLISRSPERYAKWMERMDIFIAAERSLLIITGLPRSGKKTFAQNLQLQDPNIVVYYEYNSNVSEIKSLLQDQKTVAVVSNELCNPIEYTAFVDALNLANKETAIVTYAFSRNPDLCAFRAKGAQCKKDIYEMAVYYRPHHAAYFNVVEQPIYELENM